MAIRFDSGIGRLGHHPSKVGLTKTHGVCGHKDGNVILI
jgi:hypothetical protein